MKKDDLDDLNELIKELTGKEIMTYEDYLDRLNTLDEETLDELIKIGAESKDIN